MTNKWAMLKPGTELRGYGWRDEGQQYIMTNEDVKFRFNLSQYEYDDAKGVWTLEFNGKSYCLANKNDMIEIKIPPMKKEFVTLAVKGSEWEFERDWHVNGYSQSGGTPHVVPAGTRVTILDSKMRLAYYYPQEKCIVAELVPGLEPFKRRDYATRKEYAYIPAKEASGYLKLVKPGKAKTYWKLMYGDGKEVVKKRFATINAVKASMRVRYNIVKDDTAPEWVTSGVYNRPNNSRGLYAIEYDHATDIELTREDMNRYLFMATLKA